MGSHFCCVLGWCFMERNDYQGAFDCSKSQSTDEERSLIDLKWNASLKTRQRKIYIATFFSPSRISRVFWSQSRTSCRSRFFTMFCKRGIQCWALMEWAHPFFFFQYWTLISNHPILFGTMIRLLLLLVCCPTKCTNTWKMAWHTKKTFGWFTKLTTKHNNNWSNATSWK